MLDSLCSPWADRSNWICPAETAVGGACVACRLRESMSLCKRTWLRRAVLIAAWPGFFPLGGLGSVAGGLFCFVSL